ncbi:MAG: esterase-like activity of phytase family protein [Gemmatimonadota bacterium]
MGLVKRGGLVVGLILAGAAATRQLQQEPALIAKVLPRAVLTKVKGVEVFDAGYGSSISADPSAAGYFYLLSDRGPNYDAGKDAKAFVMPAFTPRFGRFRLERGRLMEVAKIEISDSGKTPLTGIPPMPGQGGTGETALAPDGKWIPADPEGIDPEGITAITGGEFWVAEEYGPSLLHLDSHGRTLERLSPYTGGEHVLPQLFKKRRANRGIEGVSALPDGKTLMAIFEGPLDNPKAAGRMSVITRLFEYNTQSGGTRQFIYVQDAVDDHNSDIAAIDQTHFLVLERDTDMPGDSAKPAKIKRVYRIDISGATDVSDPANGADGMLFGGRSLETLAPSELQAAGIVPVKKELLVDLLALGYPHDKPEGVTVVDNHTIAVSNDDDFGLTEGPAPKLLPKLGATDFNEVYFIKLTAPLR